MTQEIIKSDALDIDVSVVPASFKIDYNVVKKTVSDMLSEYENLVVTPENLPSMKKTVPEIRAKKKAFDAACKQAIDKCKAPIDEFRGNTKEISESIEEVAKTIDDQVKVYENQQKEKIREQLEEWLVEQWEAQKVDVEYRRASIDDLVLLGSVTKTTGQLTKAVVEKVAERVATNKAFQDKIAARLLYLDNESRKAGLRAPLSRGHVESFLFSDDDEYARRLEAIIKIEVDRQVEIDNTRQPDPEPESKHIATSPESFTNFDTGLKNKDQDPGELPDYEYHQEAFAPPVRSDLLDYAVVFSNGAETVMTKQEDLPDAETAAFGMLQQLFMEGEITAKIWRPEPEGLVSTITIKR